MSGDLLVTKLFVPSLRAAFVPRPRLVARLNQGLKSGAKLTLISAPAGFGKTTLASEWLVQLADSQSATAAEKTAVAWLSLDEEDNDPTRFLTYFVAALQTMVANLGETAVAMLQSPQPPGIVSVLTALLNDIAKMAPPRTGQALPFVLVLDDYHLIASSAIHEAVGFLLENLPVTLHLVIAGRSDPPLTLSRFRARNQMIEIRQADLRFTVPEATAFLNDLMGLTLSTGQVTALESRTEGWIAGLQLAAISMRGREDIAAFVDTFSGSHRFVMDYLAEEVLRQQAEEVRRFLDQTVILERFTADLCDAVAQRDDSQEMLTRLEQDNLFIVPLDDQRQWYRYHQLFADLLRQRLDRQQLSRLPEAHRRAARWYEAYGGTDEAIHHWLAAEKPAEAARLMEAYAIRTLNRGEMVTVLGWLALLPPGLIRTRPWLLIARAWTSLLSGQMMTIAQDLQDAAQAAAGQGREETAGQILGHISAIQAYLTLMMGDISTAAEHARDALAKLPEGDFSTRSVVTYTLGGANLLQEDIEGACQSFAEAAASGQEAGNVHLAVSAWSALGTLQVQCGQLHLALDTFAKAERAATSSSGRLFPVAASAYHGQGLVFYEWNNLEAAVTVLEKGVALAEVWGNVDALISGQIYLARLHRVQGEVDKALAVLQQAEQIAQGKQVSPVTDSMLAAAWIMAWLGKGDLARAASRAAARGLTLKDHLSYTRELEYLALARLHMAQNEHQQAASLLARLRQAAEAGGRPGRAIAIMVLQAINYQAQDEAQLARETVDRALSLAGPEGYIRTFLDAGMAMRTLLEETAVRSRMTAYVTKLLGAFPGGPSPPSLAPAAPAQDWVEPLTEHEEKVLRLIAAGRSNREVAEALYVSVNTVKWHLKNIYEKLDVHSRVAAVARAQELGYL